MINFVVLGVLLTTVPLLADETSNCLDGDNPPSKRARLNSKGAFSKLPLEILWKVAEYLPLNDLRNLGSTNNAFSVELKSQIIHRSLVKHFMENPKNSWNAEFLEKVSLSSISKAINALPKNLEITRLYLGHSILTGKSP